MAIIEISFRPTASSSSACLTDRLLAAIVQHPDRPLEWWLRLRGIDAGDLAEDLVSTGRWTRVDRSVIHPRTHYADTLGTGEGHLDDETPHLHRVLDGADCGPQTAAVACIASLGGLLRRPGASLLPSEEVIARAGTAAWIVREIRDCVARMTAVAVGGGGG